MTALKKFVLIPILSVLGLLVVAGVGLYLYLSDARLRSLLEPALEETLQRDVSIDAVHLSLFRTFPHVGIGVEGLTIHTPDGPDLASIDEFWAAARLGSLFADDIEIASIELIGPRILVEPLGDGRTTLDGLGGDAEAAPADTAAASGSIRLDRISIRDGALAYADEAGTFFAIADLDADLRAVLDDVTAISGYVEAYDLTYESAGVPYARDWDLRLDVDAEADLTNEVLRLGSTRLRAEQLDIAMAGEVAGWSQDVMAVDLRIDAPDGTIEGFLSLLPRGLVKDLDGITARGAFALAATLKGDLGDDVYPALDAHLTIEDGFIQYPGLPEAITGIQLDTRVTDEAVDIASLTATAAGNTLTSRGRIVNGDATTVDAVLQIDADLASIPRFYPLEAGTRLAGTVKTNARIQGPIDAPESLQAEGTAELQGIQYASADLPQPVDALDGLLRLDRNAIRFENIVVKAGQTDATLNGALSNYMAFMASEPGGAVPAFRGQLHSAVLNADELIPEDTTDTEPLDLPDVLMDVRLTADRMVYGGIDVRDARSELHLENDILTVSGISAALFSGVLAGEIAFSTQNPEAPAFDGAIKLEGIDASRFFEKMETVNKFAQVGGYFQGVFDSQAKFSLRMDSLLNPRMETIQASGLFGAREGSLRDLPILKKLSAFTGLADLSRLALKDWSHAFSVAGEQLQVRDLDIEAGAYTVKLNGTQGLDGRLDYALSLILPASASDALLAAPVGAALRPIAGVANAALVDPATGRIVLDLLAQGAINDPELRLNSDMMKTRLESHASALVAGARQEAQARLDSLAQAQKAALEQEARDRLGGLVEDAVGDSTVAIPTNLDSLKSQGEDLVKDRLKGLLNRKKKN
ncbi:MAG: AsmA-like C-terminal region-containing protein [Rhodothermales bacterium]